MIRNRVEKFLKDINGNYELGLEVGEGVMGKVYTVNERNKKNAKSKAVKYIKFNNESSENQFKNEIKVGKMKDIELVGIRIYEHKIYEDTETNTKYGLYLMDHVNTNPRNKIMTLRKWFEVSSENGWDKLKSSKTLKTLIELLKDRLLQFYIIQWLSW